VYSVFFSLVVVDLQLFYLVCSSWKVCLSLKSSREKLTKIIIKPKPERSKLDKIRLENSNIIWTNKQDILDHTPDFWAKLFTASTPPITKHPSLVSLPKIECNSIKNLTKPFTQEEIKNILKNLRKLSAPDLGLPTKY
jgi:hypothetical protein